MKEKIMDVLDERLLVPASLLAASGIYAYHQHQDKQTVIKTSVDEIIKFLKPLVEQQPSEQSENNEHESPGTTGKAMSVVASSSWACSSTENSRGVVGCPRTCVITNNRATSIVTDTCTGEIVASVIDTLPSIANPMPFADALQRMLSWSAVSVILTLLDRHDANSIFADFCMDDVRGSGSEACPQLSFKIENGIDVKVQCKNRSGETIAFNIPYLSKTEQIETVIDKISQDTVWADWIHENVKSATSGPTISPFLLRIHWADGATMHHPDFSRSPGIMLQLRAKIHTIADIQSIIDTLSNADHLSKDLTCTPGQQWPIAAHDIKPLDSRRHSLGRVLSITKRLARSVYAGTMGESDSISQTPLPPRPSTHSATDHLKHEGQTSRAVIDWRTRVEQSKNTLDKWVDLWVGGAAWGEFEGFGNRTKRRRQTPLKNVATNSVFLTSMLDLYVRVDACFCDIMSVTSINEETVRKNVESLTREIYAFGESQNSEDFTRIPQTRTDLIHDQPHPEPEVHLKSLYILLQQGRMRKYTWPVTFLAWPDLSAS